MGAEGSKRIIETEKKLEHTLILNLLLESFEVSVLLEMTKFIPKLLDFVIVIMDLVFCCREERFCMSW